jgi:hypothetical protein
MYKIQDTLPSIDFNLASVFYRDTMDTYITKKSDFNSDFNITSQFINNNNAGGGGDYPEAVHRGLDVAVNHLSWRENSMTKVIFLLLDAPPHDTTYNQLQALTFKASEKGIRIIPVGCSGINKSTEYIMRAMALLTNGTYTFLTDDSGIGNPHIKPSTDTFKVETFNELIVRLIYQYTFYPDCNTYYPLLTNDTLDVRLPETGNMQSDNEQLLNSFRYYPNPTFGQINIELSNTAEELFIADISGKIIFRITPNGKTNLLVNLSEFTSGIYFLMYQYAPDKWIKGKIVLMH